MRNTCYACVYHAPITPARTRNIVISVQGVQCSPKCGQSFSICILYTSRQKKVSNQKCRFGAEVGIQTLFKVRKSANSWSQSAITNQQISQVCQSTKSQIRIFLLLTLFYTPRVLDNHALNLKSNSAKYYFHKKSGFLHTFTKNLL
jgi:hypothetical protein